jgi:hypothetical protein
VVLEELTRYNLFPLQNLNKTVRSGHPWLYADALVQVPKDVAPGGGERGVRQLPRVCANNSKPSCRESGHDLAMHNLVAPTAHPLFEPLLEPPHPGVGPCSWMPCPAPQTGSLALVKTKTGDILSKGYVDPGSALAYRSLAVGRVSHNSRGVGLLGCCSWYVGYW